MHKRYCLDGRTATAHFPGIGRYVVNLARALEPLLQDDEELVVLRDPRGNVLFDGLAASSARVRIVDVPVSPFSLRQHWVLPAVLREQKVHMYHSPYTLLPLIPGVPTIVTVHDMIPLLFPSQSSAKARWLFRAALFLALRAADTVLVLSESTRTDLVRMTSLRKEQIQVCLAGVSPDFSPKPEKDAAAVRRKFGLPERYIMYAGSDKPHKNLKRLLEAWGMLCSREMTDGAGLVIAGVRLQEHADSGSGLEGVSILGRVSDSELQALYSGALCLVFPSFYEGFGLPVLEAMACGAPVLCSESSSLPEVAGDAGVFFDPNNPAEIAERIHEILNDEEKRACLRDRGLLRATELTWPRCAVCTLQIYRSLVLSSCREQAKEDR